MTSGTILCVGRGALTLALFLAAVASGCSGQPAVPGGGGALNVAGMGWTADSFRRDHCSTPTRTDVPECAGTFCAPSSLGIEVRSDSTGASWTCEGYDGADFCQGNDVYQAYLLDLPAIYLYVSFKPEIVRERDPEAVVRHFHHLWFNAYFPDRRPDGFFEQLTFHKGDKAIKRFEMRGDLLEIEVEPPPLDQVSYPAQSRDKDCFSGDILGVCPCTYNLPSVPVRVKATLDLRAARPKT